MTLPLNIETPGADPLPSVPGSTPGTGCADPVPGAHRAPLPRSTAGDEPDPAGGNLAKGPAGSGLVLSFIAHGTPKPKGSMRHVGNGRMVEQVDGKPWRESVKWAAREAMRDAPGADIVSDKVGGVCHKGFPLEGPLRVHVVFTVRKPSSAPKRRRTWPVTRSSGDLDKQLRNLFDAMGDAGAFGDDSQIVEVEASKRYPLEGDDALTYPGVVVRLYTVTGDTA